MFRQLKAAISALVNPNHIDIARRELAFARCKLMEAEAAKSYANAMIQYHREMIERHEALLSQPVTFKEIAQK